MRCIGAMTPSTRWSSLTRCIAGTVLLVHAWLCGFVTRQYTSMRGVMVPAQVEQHGCGRACQVWFGSPQGTQPRLGRAFG